MPVTDEHAAAVAKVKAAVDGMVGGPWYLGIEDIPVDGIEEVGEIRHGKRRWSEYVTHVFRVDGHLVGVGRDEPSTENGEWPGPGEWTVEAVAEKTVIAYEVIR